MINNKKGFTLVEVIGIVTILSLILLIALPALTKTLKRNEQKRYDNYANSLKSATESYIVNNINKFPELKENEGKIYVTLETLLSEGYINETKKDPSLSDNEQPDAVLVTINADGTFNYELKISETLTEKTLIDLMSSTCTEDSLSGCIYTENTSNNYVWYGGFLWRVLWLTDIGDVEMITADNLVSITAGVTDSNYTAENWINTYENGLKNSLPKDLEYKALRLITENEFLTSQAEFLTNTGSMIVKGSAHEVFYSADKKTTNSYSTGGVRPIITLASEIKISGGKGTADLPYTLQGDESASVGTNITSLKVGEFIRIPLSQDLSDTALVRLVSQKDGFVKVVFNDSYINDIKATEIIANAQKIETENLELNKLLDTRTTSWKDHNLSYNSTNSSYSISCSSGNVPMVSVNYDSSVGILTLREMFAAYNNGVESHLGCVYVDESSDADSIMACISDENGMTFNWPSTSADYRPAAYLSPLLKVTGGNGTKNNPYIISY